MENHAVTTADAAPDLDTETVWFLSGQVSESEPVRHVPIHSSPFVVGRRSDCSFSIPLPTISGKHAELIVDESTLVLRDLTSTNGTYVNGTRLEGSTFLNEGDLVQFAEIPFRVQKQSSECDSATVQENVCDLALALVQFDKIMGERAVTPHYQPIVALDDASVHGYEVLGRSEVYGLQSAAAMFRAASQLNLEVELSRIFRCEGIKSVSDVEPSPHLFVNTHPNELEQPGLIDSMVSLRDEHPHMRITLEIHEKAVTDPTAMRYFREALDDMGVGLAYDDFGAGQTRLVELVEVRPDYLKFDMSLIRGIDQASLQRQQMVGTLVRMTKELGVLTLAEGVETAQEADACSQLGFEFAQGFFFGRPAPPRNFFKPPRTVK